MENDIKNEIRDEERIVHGKEGNVRSRDVTKDKIILFVIGVLVGAVISTGAFFAYIKLAGLGVLNGQSSMMQGQGGTPPEMPGGESNMNNQGGTPPDMPSGDNGQPPEMPSGDNSGNGQGGTPPAKPNSNNSQSNS